MSDAVTKSSGGGISLVGVLLVVFIVLKILKVITWPWWQVILLPFAIGIGLAVGIVAVVLVILALAALVVSIFDR